MTEAERIKRAVWAFTEIAQWVEEERTNLLFYPDEFGIPGLGDALDVLDYIQRTKGRLAQNMHYKAALAHLELAAGELVLVAEELKKETP